MIFEYLLNKSPRNSASITEDICHVFLDFCSQQMLPYSVKLLTECMVVHQCVNDDIDKAIEQLGQVESITILRFGYDVVWKNGWHQTMALTSRHELNRLSVHCCKSPSRLC